MVRSARFSFLPAALVWLAVTGPAWAEGPVYKDLERFGPPAGRGAVGEPADLYVHRAPGRRVNSGPGYAGSEYGLGKPAFTGLGSRPDWGRSSD